MNTVNLTDKHQMVGFLKTVGTGSSIVSLNTETEVKMRKTGNPYLGTVKVANRSGLINVNFVGAVNRKLAELKGESLTEGEKYEAGTTWYKHVQTEEGKPLPLCVHKTDENRFYLQFFPLKKKAKVKHTYWMNGRQLTEAEVEHMKTFITEKEQSVIKPIVITLAIDSIRNMKARNVTILNSTIDRIAQGYAQLTPAQPPLTKTV